MSSMQSMRELMGRAGPVLDLQQVTEFAADRTWVLVYDAETQVDAEYDEARDRLMLTEDVAVVSDADRARVHEALLQYSYLWSTHGGVRPAVDPSRAMAVLMLELRAEDLELSRLCTILDNFRGIVEAWRDAIAAMPAPAGAGEAQVSEAMIRV